MKLLFKGNYKSLTDFESDKLESFTVITGKNGTGKSQLLNAVKNCYPPYKGGTKDTENYTLDIDYSINKVQAEGLKKETFSTSLNTVSVQKIQGYVNAFNGLTSSKKELIEFIYTNDLTIEDFQFFNYEKLSELYGKDITQLLDRVITENGTKGHLPSQIEYIFSKLKPFLELHTSLLSLLSVYKEHKGVAFSEIESKDFFLLPIPEYLIDTQDLFESKIETIFHTYSQRRFYNDYFFHLKSQNKQINNSISDADFISQFPPPWEIINDILDTHGVGLRFGEIEFSNFINSSYSIEVNISKEGIAKKLRLEDLSSGEQVILGLILKLFTSSYYQDFTYPDLILLDEPDAYLHPEMTKLMIDVLHKTFVIKLGIKVIITTHSPSTIALTPEDCIYEMKNGDKTSLKKITKDHALNLLTENIPTLSIDYKNHRQVFVESPTDIGYYQRLYDKINSLTPCTYKLYFISNQMGKGNCTWVKEIVEKLRISGVNKTYGVIDWDAINMPTSSILVHGYNKVYSIENFLCDGIYLAILLMEMNAHNIRAELGISETYMEYHIINERQDQLQKVWDFIISKIQIQFPKLKSDSFVKVEYYNGIVINVPEWINKMKGHDLLEKIRITFPAFEKYRNEGELQDKLSLIMAKCYPLVPQDSITLLRSICF